jgi:signal transduction histidine kinase
MPEMVTKSQLDNLLAIGNSPKSHTIVEESDPSLFFQILKDLQQNPTTTSITRRHCAPGEIVFSEGQEVDTMYMVLAGRAAIVKGDLNIPTLLGIRGAGTIFGEMALLEDQPGTFTIIAIENLSLLGITRKRFQQFLQELPSLSIHIIEMLASRLRLTDEARARDDVSEKRLADQILSLQTEKQRLEELERLRQETMELIIHDLRNPLNAINLSLNTFAMVLPEDFPSSNRQLLDVARMSVEHMKGLVDSLLEVSRIESGESEFRMADTDLSDLIQEVARRFALMDIRGIDLWLQISSDLPKVQLDGDKICRVLANLLDNAFRYTPENGRITIAAECFEEGLKISVSDTGPGIAPEQRERIFTRFAQASGDKQNRRGFGLGLTYCRLTVERHGGKIWVEDGEGGIGSRFVFMLPLKQPMLNLKTQ